VATIPELVARVEANGHEVWSSGPQPEAAIAVLERTLGVRLPPSYHDFLATYGGMSIYDSVVSGIVDEDPLREVGGSLYGDTKRFQGEWGLPDYLLVVQPDEDAPYCFDTRRPGMHGEFPVICYELHSRHERTIAAGFDEWMRTVFLHWADAAR
jgi:hypothetical protein